MILLILFTSLSLGWAEELKPYRIGSLTIFFHKVDGLWVNKNCLDSKCEAISKGKKFIHSEISADLLIGGKNPFAVKCKTVMEGTVFIAMDKSGNEQSLCHFSDDSFLK